MLDKHKIKAQVDIIKMASERAQKKIDYTTAHNPEIIHAIDIIERFLKRKHRICYGGQAINAHLPTKYKFYNPEYSIPDYDFFTPSQMEDIRIIIRDLKRAGFTDISAREGMHDGTIKIYVNFIPIADITVLDKSIYNILSKRESRIDGISYLNPNALRMLMYLELSRPAGEVTRWSKVYERLMIFNEFVPIKKCNHLDNRASINHLTKEQLDTTIHYIIDQKCIFAGAELVSFYNSAVYKKKKQTEWLISTKKAVLFYSPDSEKDSLQLMEQLQQLDQTSDEFFIKSYSSKGIVPSMKVICKGKTDLIFIIDQSACHSFFNVKVGMNVMKIATIDSLISLYFSLGLINNHFMDMGSMECLANQLVALSVQARTRHDTFIFPFISIKCVGHQQTLPSLIRDKIKRVHVTRKKLKNIVNRSKSIVNKKYTNKL
jgi:hypothetical protein